MTATSNPLKSSTHDESNRAKSPMSLSLIHDPSIPLPSIISKPETETFITQRGLKIINEIHTPEMPSLFDSRRELQSTLLLQKKKEMQNIQTLLEKKRIEFAKRMEECREKQDELRTKQKQIRDRVMKFEKFLKENDAKRQRANIKAQTERKTKELKEAELNSFLLQLRQEERKAEQFVCVIKKHQIFEDFLQSVVDSLPTDYLDINEPHINDVLMRHKTLLETNEDLILTIQEFQDNIENEQANLATLIKEKNDLILVYNSSLGSAQKKLEKIKQDAAYLEQRLKERDNSGKERMRIIGEAKMAINNLYNRISSKSNDYVVVDGQIMKSTNDMTIDSNTGFTNSFNDKTMADKLHAIQDRFLDLQLVVQKVEQFTLREKERK